MKLRPILTALITVVCGLWPLMGLAEIPTEAKVFDNGKKCQISIRYSKGAVGGRPLTASDVKWLMSQPGGVQRFRDMNPNLHSGWLKKFIADNKPFTQLPLESPSGTKACRALEEMAKQLTDRAKNREWPNEDSQSVMIEGLMPGKIPPLDGSIADSGGHDAGANTPTLVLGSGARQ